MNSVRFSAGCDSKRPQTWRNAWFQASKLLCAEDRVCTGHLLTATAIVIVVWRGNYRATQRCRYD